MVEKQCGITGAQIANEYTNMLRQAWICLAGWTAPTRGAASQQDHCRRGLTGRRAGNGRQGKGRQEGRPHTTTRGPRGPKGRTDQAPNRQSRGVFASPEGIPGASLLGPWRVLGVVKGVTNKSEE